MKQSVLLKITLLFLVITLLPVSVILFYYSPQTYKIISDTAATDINFELERVTTAINTEFDKLYRISSQIKGQRNMWRTATLSYSQTAQNTEALKAHTIQCDLIKDIVLYRNNSDVLYTAGGIITKNYFGDEIYNFSQINSQDELDALITSADAPKLLYFDRISREGSDSEHYCFLFPLQQNHGCILFMLDSHKLEQLVLTKINLTHSYAITSNNHIAVCNIPDLSGTTVKNLDELYDDPNIMHYQKDFSYADIGLNILVDSSELNRQFLKLKLITVLILFGIVFVGVCAFAIYIRSNYQPLLRILQSLSEEEKPETSPQSNEYGIIQSAIQNMKLSNRSLNSRVDKYLTNYKNYFVYLMVSGYIREENNISDIEESLEMELYERFLFCGFLILDERKSETAEDLNQISSVMTEEVQKIHTSIRYLFTPYPEANAVFIFFSCEETDCIIARHYLNDIKQTAERKLSKNLCHFLYTDFSNNLFDLVDQVVLMDELLKQVPKDLWKNGNQLNINHYPHSLPVIEKEPPAEAQKKISKTYHHSEVLEYIAQNYLHPNFSITTLADSFGLHPSNLSVYFKKQEETSFQQYVTNLKIAKAQELLKEQKLSTEEISSILGYANSSSFGRTFKRVTGITPGEFKAKQSI